MKMIGFCVQQKLELEPKWVCKQELNK